MSYFSATGKIVKRTSLEKEKFIQDIKNLAPFGGGDCPELAFAGMKNALSNISEMHNTAMFVFTDAPAKDSSEDKVANLLSAARFRQISISFFLSRKMCSNNIHDFRKISDGTSG